MSKESKESTTEKQVSRRSMLKWTGGLAAAAVVGAGIGLGAGELLKPPPPPPVSFKPPLSPETQERVDAIIKAAKDMHQGETVYYTMCGQNGCQNGNCLVKMRVKNGVCTAIETDDLINPGKPREDVSEGALKAMQIQHRACAMGRAWRADMYDPNRFLYPMKRVGERGEGKFVRISWDEALDTAANMLKQTKEKYGTLSLYGRPPGYVPMGYHKPAVSQYYGMGFVYHGNASFMAGDLALQYHVGRRGAQSNPTSDVLNAKLIVYWGFTTTMCNGGGTRYYLALAREKGIPMIVIDPRYTYDAEFADQWIPIRAGTDEVMMQAIMNILFKENLYDKEFVAKYVEPTSFQKWKDYILGVTEGPDGKIDRTPEWAEKICGVPAETIRAFAALYAKSKPVQLRLGYGPGRREYGEKYATNGLFLTAMTGNVGGIGSGGTGWYGMTSRPGQLPVPDVVNQFNRADLTKIYVAPNIIDGTGGKLHEAILLREPFEKGEITKEEYNKRVSSRAIDPVPNVKMIWEAGNKPIGCTPDMNKMIRALKKVDFFVGHAGANLAGRRYFDLVLPRTFSMMEDNLFVVPYLIDGLQLIAYHPQPVNLPGEVRPSEWVQVQIANRLGIGDTYNPVLKNVPWGPQWEQKLSELSAAEYERWRKLADIARLNPPSWEEFKKKPVFRFPLPDAIPLAYAPYFNAGFPTKSGKIEFWSEFLSDPVRATAESPLYGVYDGPVTPMPFYVGSTLGRDDMWSPDTKKFPLYALCKLHSHYRQHSLHDSNALLNDEYRHACWMSIADAKARGIKDGDKVRVFNDVGELIMPAYVTPRMVPGVVGIPWGSSYRASGAKTSTMPDGIDIRGASNMLTHDYYTPGFNCPGAALCDVQKLL